MERKSYEECADYISDCFDVDKQTVTDIIELYEELQDDGTPKELPEWKHRLFKCLGYKDYYHIDNLEDAYYAVAMYIDSKPFEEPSKELCELSDYLWDLYKNSDEYREDSWE